MEILKSFTAIFDDDNNCSTKFKIVTNNGVYKVVWKYKEIPTERENMFTRCYENNIRQFCKEHYINMREYEKAWERDCYA